VSLHLVPVSQAVAEDCVVRWHRHLDPPVGDIFRVGVATDDGVLVAVGIAGRPTARNLQDGQTIEVTRIAADGTRNACSMLYGALRRAGFALGYTRVITYTQDDEGGASLRAAGYRVVAQRPPHKGWSRPSRPRDDSHRDLIARTLWEAS
jgi:hypothetical protein